ncbi:MAG: hypothetical protein EOO39_00170 [Cytophagaceae bacterium]|nr:MAG: hypothetical protein EOO39_00170 [Cytophagaceae bacterium]
MEIPSKADLTLSVGTALAGQFDSLDRRRYLYMGSVAITFTIGTNSYHRWAIDEKPSSWVKPGTYNVNSIKPCGRKSWWIILCNGVMISYRDLNVIQQFNLLMALMSDKFVTIEAYEMD